MAKRNKFTGIQKFQFIATLNVINYQKWKTFYFAQSSSPSMLLKNKDKTPNFKQNAVLLLQRKKHL